MPEYECPYPDCSFKTKDVTDELAAVMLKIHAAVHKDSTSHQRPLAKRETVRRPVIAAGGRATVKNGRIF